MTAFGVIQRHRREPQSLGWVVARIDPQGRATLTGASVYELREDADHTAAQCIERSALGWAYIVAEVIPVPP